MIACSVCRAENTAGPVCRRCRADLGLLFQLEEQRALALAAATRHVAHGEGSAAALCAGHAHWLRRAEDSGRVLAMGRLLGRDFAGAWDAYRSLPATSAIRERGSAPRKGSEYGSKS
jgi:hypothetical protein